MLLPQLLQTLPHQPTTVNMSTPESSVKTAVLNLPLNLSSMSNNDVKKWCKDNWAIIEQEHITIASLKSLLKKLRASRTALNKKAAISKLLEIMRKEEEQGEEQLMRRGKQSCEECKEADQTWEEEEEEVAEHGRVEQEGGEVEEGDSGGVHLEACSRCL